MTVAGMLSMLMSPFLLLAFPEATSASCITPCALQGSLVMLILTQDGLVIVADKRTKDRYRGICDDSTKVEQIDEFTAVASTGLTTHVAVAGNTITNIKLFDANEIVRSYLLSVPPDVRVGLYLDSVGQELQRCFLKLLQSFPVEKRPVPPANGEEFFTVMVRYHPLSREYETCAITFKYQGSAADPQLSFSVKTVPLTQGDQTLPFVFGQNQVANELVLGTDPRFNKERAHPFIQRVQRGQMDIREMSETEVIDGALHIIDVTSKKLSLLVPDDYPVGNTADVAIISNKGFSWKHLNVSTKRLTTESELLAPHSDNSAANRCGS